MATGASTADLAIVLVDARQGVLRADAAPFDHRLAARHPPHRAGGQQDRPRRISTRRCSTGSSPTMRDFAEDLGFAIDRADPDVGALRRQCHAALGQDRPGMPGRRWSSISRRSWSTMPPSKAVPLSGAVCEPPEPRFPRLCRHGRLRLGRAGRRGRRRQVRQGRRASSASSPRAATCRAPSPARR